MYIFRNIISLVCCCFFVVVVVVDFLLFFCLLDLFLVFSFSLYLDV